MMRLSIFVMTALALAGCQRAEEAAPSAEPKQAAANDPPLAKTVSDSTLQWGACPVFPPGCEVAVLHGDPAKPNADVFFRVPAGYAVPAHFHNSAERMILVTGRLDVKYQGAQPVTLYPGNYAYGPARLPHRATCMAAEACTLFIAFEGPVDVEPFEGPLG
jgi:mannose-6-phosphate isomerase-like protein (cupin superfamily)